MICPYCGKPKKIDFTIGLGKNGLVPAYVERDTCKCKQPSWEIPDEETKTVVEVTGGYERELIVSDTFFVVLILIGTILGVVGLYFYTKRGEIPTILFVLMCAAFIMEMIVFLTAKKTNSALHIKDTKKNKDNVNKSSSSK